MSKRDRDWIPDAVDLDWIESLAKPLPAALAALEAAGRANHIPIVDRDAGRVLSVLAGSHRRIVEVGTAYGYSTLWMALGQPADGTIVTIDPDRERTDLARGWWREAGIADERITVVNAPALDAIGTDRALAGPFDMVFIDALKPEYEAYLAALSDRLVPGALVAADNVLWSGRASGSRPAAADDANTAALRAFDAAVMADPRLTATILPVGDGLLVATWRG
jgi:predicted O-methyltransferase YrrM